MHCIHQLTVSAGNDAALLGGFFCRMELSVVTIIPTNMDKLDYI